MRTLQFRLGAIPAVVWGAPSDTVYLAVHGNLSNKEDTVIRMLAERLNTKGIQLLSFDLPEHVERRQDTAYLCKVQNCVADLGQVMAYARQHWRRINLWACSMGAYFSLLAYRDQPLDRALFLSPVVDMQSIIENLMRWSGTTEEKLKTEQEIPTEFGQTLYWDCYTYVKEHPVTVWNPQTQILYGRQDTMQTAEMIRTFSNRFSCGLTVLDDAEHFFHTEQQLAQYESWLNDVLT